MKLVDGVYLVGSGRDGVFLTDELDCNCYLLELDGKLALFDCGIGIRPELLIQEIKRDGFCMEDISYLFLTHCHGDHIGAAAYLQKQYGIRVVVPEMEAEAFAQGDEAAMGLDVARAAGYYPADYRIESCRADETAAPGTWAKDGIAMKLFAAQGHSIGGICYYGTVKGRRFFIGGDMVRMGGKISFQLIPGADIHAYARCIWAVEKLEVDLFLPGHGLFQLQDGKKQLRMAGEAFRQLYIPA
jgi:glyoxylase-like metal-dependent hydrolase (beta-lactamase superfamily II)